MQTVDSEGLPIKILGWCPPERRRKGNSWRQDVTSITGMREMGIKNLEWVDTKGFRRKIKLKL